MANITEQITNAFISKYLQDAFMSKEEKQLKDLKIKTSIKGYQLADLDIVKTLISTTNTELEFNTTGKDNDQCD